VSQVGPGILQIGLERDGLAIGVEGFRKTAGVAEGAAKGVTERGEGWLECDSALQEFDGGVRAFSLHFQDGQEMQGIHMGGILGENLAIEGGGIREASGVLVGQCGLKRWFKRGGAHGCMLPEISVGRQLFFGWRQGVMEVIYGWQGGSWFVIRIGIRAACRRRADTGDDRSQGHAAGDGQDHGAHHAQEDGVAEFAGRVGGCGLEAHEYLHVMGYRH
jgi:hypothetical protein